MKPDAYSAPSSFGDPPPSSRFLRGLAGTSCFGFAASAFVRQSSSVGLQAMEKSLFFHRPHFRSVLASDCTMALASPIMQHWTGLGQERGRIRTPVPSPLQAKQSIHDLDGVYNPHVLQLFVDSRFSPRLLHGSTGIPLLSTANSMEMKKWVLNV